MARLAPQQKQRIRRRAEVHARREFAGSMAGARAAIDQANRDYGREVTDAQGAQRAYQSAINRMLGGLGRSGMGRRYENQLRKDLQLRKAESQAGVPYAVAQAQQRRSDAISTARSDAAESQAKLRAAVGRRQNKLLDAARKSAMPSRGLKNASIVARTVLDATTAMDQQALLSNPRQFAAMVAKEAEGADPVDALRAVERLKKRYDRKFRRQKPIGTLEWQRETAKRSGRLGR